MKFVAGRRQLLKAAIVPAAGVAPIAFVRDAAADTSPLPAVP